MKASHEFSPDSLLAGNAYYRSNTIDTFNGDVAEDCAQFVKFSECLDEDGELAPSAVARQSRTDENGTGVQVQLNYLRDLFELDNKLTFGTSYDYGHTDFNQNEQAAAFTSNRGTEALEDPVPVTQARVINQYLGIFGTDTLSPTTWLHLNASGRWNRAEIDLSGFGTDEDNRERTSLAGHHIFNRFNPSAGFTLQPLDALSVEGGPVKDLTLKSPRRRPSR